MSAGPSVRTAVPQDAAQLSAILNEIIRVGGTTAMETELTEAEILDHYITGPEVICCHVAIDAGQDIAGFQALEFHPKLPRDIGDIATFARQSPKVPGVGRALFPKTVEVAVAKGLSALNAVIRADNVAGLGYYAKIGFIEHDVLKDIPLQDGTPVDRIVRRYALQRT